MKKQFIAILLLSVVFTSCQTNGLKLVKNVEKYFKAHCPETRAVNPLNGNLQIHYECGELWNVGKLGETCSQANVCIDLAQGKFWGDIVCDSIVDPYYLLKSVRPSQPKAGCTSW